MNVGGDGWVLGEGGGVRRQRMEAAAVLALWCHFADFCMAEAPDESQAVASVCGLVEARLSPLSPADWPPSHFTYLALVGMYQDLSELRCVEGWLREPELASAVGARLTEHGLPQVCPPPSAAAAPWPPAGLHACSPGDRAS